MSVRANRPAILDRIPRDRDAVLEASAGTGKTYALEHLVVELVLEGTPIEKVLVVTFTEQATADLRKRIRERLAALRALQTDEPDDGTRPWIIDATARGRLATALSALDSATILTLHGFCHRVLAELAFDAGRLFTETQVDAAGAFERAFLDALRDEGAVEPAQRELLEAWLQDRKLEALHELLWECSRTRAELRPGGVDRAAFVAAIQALPSDARLEREVIEAVTSTKMHGATRKKVLRLLGEIFALGREVAAGASFSALFAKASAWVVANPNYLPEKLAGIARARPVAEAVERLGAVTPPLPAALAQALLPVVKARLDARKRQAGELDFDDMLTLVRDALRGERGPAFAQALRERYAFALIDEFQDTDEVQWEIFGTLFHEQPGCRLYVIGDPKQAIYGFRGADVQTYLEARERILADGGAPVPLAQNFRSTGEMLGAINAILDPLAQPPFFDGAIRYDHPVTCGKPGLRLFDGRGQPAHPVELWHLHGRAKLSNAAAKATLARRIVEEVRAILDGPGLKLGDARVEPGDIYVIAQKNEEQRLVGRVLREAGLPVAFFKQEGLFATREAADVLDLLRALAAPTDRAARRSAWLTPFFALGLEEVAVADEVPSEHPLMARLLAWRGLAEARRYERLFAAVLDESGLARRELFLAASERELTNYQHLFELLLAEVHRTHSGLAELARILEGYVRGTSKPPGTDTDIQRLESDRRAIQVMSLHKSKGLEAAVVFLFGGFSRSKSRNVWSYHEGRKRCAWVGPKDFVKQQVDLETELEQRRLLYVGMTRAKGRLYLPLVDELEPDEQTALVERHRRPQESRLDMAGPYRWLNARLAAMRAAGELTAERGFVRRFVRVAQIGEDAEPQPGPLHWDPDPKLLDEPAVDARPVELRRRHAGFFVTSYSRMAGARGEDEETPVKPAMHAPFVELPADHLARGAGSGRFIHEALEHLALEEVARAERFESWSATPAVAAHFDRLARRHGIERRQLAHAKRLVWNALRTELELPRGRLDGIASAERVLRELEFLYPIPERGHPLLDGAKGAFSIERGCIKGFIDLVFEHQGRVYFADWKSDVLADYAPATLGAHVEAHYAIQEKLYALALVRQLGLRSERDFEQRFGGSLYLFVRGMDRSGQGVHAARPSWREVVGWEQALIDERNWGISA